MKTISKLKKELDKWFSLFIRLRHASKDGIVQCYTCDKTGHYKKGMHAGHFMSRRHLSTRWHEENVQVQCYRCNMHLSGNVYAYSKLLDIRIEEGTAEKLNLLATRSTVKFMRCDYEELIEKYKEKVNAIKADLS